MILAFACSDRAHPSSNRRHKELSYNDGIKGNLNQTTGTAPHGIAAHAAAGPNRGT